MQTVSSRRFGWIQKNPKSTKSTYRFVGAMFYRDQFDQFARFSKELEITGDEIFLENLFFQ